MKDSVVTCIKPLRISLINFDTPGIKWYEIMDLNFIDKLDNSTNLMNCQTAGLH